MDMIEVWLCGRVALDFQVCVVWMGLTDGGD